MQPNSSELDVIDLPLSNSYSYGIDFLRGVLSLWVFFAHLISWATYSGQNVPIEIQNFFSTLIFVFQPQGELHPAVLCFIVLSGYCIHKNGLRRNQLNLLPFFLRRFFRIWPLFIISCFLGVMCFMFAYAIDPIKTQALTGIKEISWFCVVIKIIGISTLFPQLHTCSFVGNAPTITVLVEEYLYLLYAVVSLFLLVRPKGERLFLVALFFFTLFGYFTYSL